MRDDAASSPVYLDSAETVGAIRVVPDPVVRLAPELNVAAGRVTVRREVSDCVKGCEMRVPAVAIFALAGALLCANVAA